MADQRTVGTSITNDTFFMQTQNGEWVKLGDYAEVAEATDTQNDVAFTIKPRTFSGTFVIDNRARTKIRRTFLGFKGHPRMKNLMKAIRLCNGDIHQKGR